MPMHMIEIGTKEQHDSNTVFLNCGKVALAWSVAQVNEGLSTIVLSVRVARMHNLLQFIKLI